MHHANQSRAVAGVAPSALVLEMLTPDQAERAALADRSDAEALAERLDWETSGWPDFAMYHPVFTAARDARIYGGAVPRDAIERSMQSGAAAAFGPESATYGLDAPLAAGEQALREADQAAAHCDALPPELLPGMVAAQRLRDAAMARAVLSALDETGGPVVLITGNGHARTDRGVPAYLGRVRPELDVVSVGQLEAEQDDAPYDLWVVTEPVERPDPCAAFR